MYRMQRRELETSPSGWRFEFVGGAGIHNPSGGGVHDFQLSYQGSADRGERRLNGAF